MRTGPNDYPRDDNQSISIDHFANIILDVCTLLLESGAHCERINRNIQRIASSSPYDVEILLSFTAVYDKNNLKNTITINKRVNHHGVHFGILTDAYTSCCFYTSCLYNHDTWAICLPYDVGLYTHL